MPFIFIHMHDENIAEKLILLCGGSCVIETNPAAEQMNYVVEFLSAILCNLYNNMSQIHSQMVI